MPAAARPGAPRPLPRVLTIRNRIAGGSLVIALLISLAAGIVFNAQIERILRDGSIAVLQSDSAAYVSALQNQDGGPLDPPGLGQHIAVVAPDGSTPVNTLPSALRDMLPNLVAAHTPRSVTPESAQSAGISYLVLSTPITTAGGEWHVVAARSGHEESTVLDEMRLLLFVGLALIVLGTAATAWLLTSAALAPVKRLRASAEELSASPGTELLPVASARDEIAELAETLNELIVRLRASASRERQLVSDASHELRTPLAILTMQLQLAEAEASSVEQLLEDVAGARRNVARLTALVNSLLELSTLEGLAAREEGGLSDAAELEREARDAVERARFRFGSAAIELSYEGLAGPGAGAQFAIKAEDFGRIIDNLASNAVTAMPGGGALTVTLALARGALVLRVADTGGGLEPGFEAHALERFSRGDASRAAGRGTGLGLAIVAAIVTNAGGTIALENSPGVGLTVTVTLPAVGAPPAAPTPR
ncbi:Signal transduction histidine kinase [Microterricola viridarii]|uniref:histidine kinase n=1 Tax=Microterricola viridarii TaxID=412690 RepID=A0A1H1PG45_9MICO|nr:Signal transduction histidine kinase [Microterricola viridarii]